MYESEAWSLRDQYVLAGAVLIVMIGMVGWLTNGWLGERKRREDSDKRADNSSMDALRVSVANVSDKVTALSDKVDNNAQDVKDRLNHIEDELDDRVHKRDWDRAHFALTAALGEIKSDISKGFDRMNERIDRLDDKKADKP